MIIQRHFGKIEFIIKNDLKNYLLKLKTKNKTISIYIKYYKNKKSYIMSIDLPFSYEYILNLKLNQGISIYCSQLFFDGYISEYDQKVALALSDNLKYMSINYRKGK